VVGVKRKKCLLYEKRGFCGERGGVVRQVDGGPFAGRSCVRPGWYKRVPGSRPVDAGGGSTIGGKKTQKKGCGAGVFEGCRRDREGRVCVW